MTVSVRKDLEQDFSLPVRSVLIVPERIRTRLIRVTDSASKAAIVRTTVRANKAISPVRAATVRATIRASKAISLVRAAMEEEAIRPIKAISHKASVRVQSIRNII